MSIILHESGIAIADDQSKILPSCTMGKPLSFKSANDYSRYVLSCLVEINKENLVFYRLPIRFMVYRGDPKYSEDVSYPSGHLQFSFNAEDASMQGIIHEFMIASGHEPLLLAMDRVSNIEMLMAHAIKDKRHDVIKALAHNFYLDRSVNGQITIVRQTDPALDQTILDYLCSLGFQGLAFKPLGNHAAKLMFCDAHTVFMEGNYSKYNASFTHRLF
jgi:hypothetical protein